MNHDPNTTHWQPGDLVIHDADAKRPEMLMRVLYSDVDEFTTKYLSPHTLALSRGTFKNSIGYLHDPARFGIDVTREFPAVHAEMVRLRAENERLTKRLTEHARRALRRLLSDLSEEHWCAGWLTDWEFMVWEALLQYQIDPTQEWETGNWAMQPITLEEIRQLSEAAGGWIVWDDTTSETFILMAEWLPRYAEYAAKWYRRQPATPLGGTEGSGEAQ